jgi:hypothetical protein
MTEEQKQPSELLKKVPQKAMDLLKKYPDKLKDPMQMLQLLMQISEQVLRALLEGKEVYIGGDGEFQKFEVGTEGLRKEGPRGPLQADRQESTGE